MATSKVVVNDLIQFEMGDVELEQFLRILQKNARLIMNCIQCGTTILPQARNHAMSTGQTEFKVSCVHCGRSHDVRMHGPSNGSYYGFILPTDDEFYKGAHIVNMDGWEHD